MKFKVINQYKFCELEFVDSNRKTWLCNEIVEDNLRPNDLMLCLQANDPSRKERLSLKDIANNGQRWEIEGLKAEDFLQREVYKPLFNWLKERPVEKGIRQFFEPLDNHLPRFINPWVLSLGTKELLEMLESDRKCWATESSIKKESIDLITWLLEKLRLNFFK